MLWAGRVAEEHITDTTDTGVFLPVKRHRGEPGGTPNRYLCPCPSCPLGAPAPALPTESFYRYSPEFRSMESNATELTAPRRTCSPTEAEAATAAPVTSAWRCDICDVTITTRGDGRAEACHLAGKPHLKKLRALGLAPKAEPRQPTEQASSASVDPSLRCADASTNSKSVLNELCQQRQWKLRYEVASQQGPNHAPEYTFRVVIERSGQPAEHFVGTSAPNKRLAEATAATEALRRLLHEGISYEPEKNTGKVGCGHASRGSIRWSLGCALHPDDVFRVISAELPRSTLQPEHYACAWNRLAKLSREAGRPLPASDSRVASLLHATLQRLTAADAAGVSSGSSRPVVVLPWGARELANVAHGVTVALGLPHGGERDASASFGRTASALFDACVLRALGLMHTIKPQELSNFVWALSKAAHHAPAFLDAAARVATV